MKLNDVQVSFASELRKKMTASFSGLQRRKTIHLAPRVAAQIAISSTISK